jgi:hypothetical protein
MGFVDFAHFAEVESLLFLVMLWALSTYDEVIVGGRTRDYLLAGVATGLAFSTKYTVWILAVPFLAAHFRGRGWRRGMSARGLGLLAAATVAGIAAFVGTTPYAVLHWRDFYDTMVYNWYTGAPMGTLVNLPRSWIPYLELLGNAFGWPLFLLTLVGAAWAAARLWRGETASAAGRAYVIHGIWIAAFYGFYGASSHRALRFIMPIVPSLALLAAAAVVDIVRRIPHPAKRGAQAAIVAIMIYTVAYTAAADRMFLHDTRYEVGTWLKSHRLNPSAAVNYFAFEAYVPYFDDPKFPVYPVPFVANSGLRGDRFHKVARQFLDGSSDLIVESQFYYQRFLDYPQRLFFPEREVFYQRLLAGRDPSGYRPIRWFTYRNPWWLNPRPERIAPTMVVLGKPVPTR